MLKKRTIIGLILIPLALFFSFKTLIDYLFISKASSTPFFYNECEKVWGHRGYFKSHEQNSLNSYRAAFDLGAEGTELDIFYDIEMNDFVVSHDFPYKLKDGKLLMLDEVFNVFGNTYYYWLDFKNLKKMSEKDVRSSVLKMSLLMDKYNIKNKIIIESTSVNKLFQLSKAGFHTSHWISFNENIGGLEYWKRSYKLKIKYLLGYFSAISMDYRIYTLKLKKSFSGLPILLFTINDEPTVMEYVMDDSVKVILSDESLYVRKSNACALQQ